MGYSYNPTHNKKTIPKRTQESGIVLIDKGRVLQGLLSTCKQNEPDRREQIIYRHLYGDKDTGGIGFHLAWCILFIHTHIDSVNRNDSAWKIMATHLTS